MCAWIMPIQFLAAFLHAISIVVSVFKIPWHRVVTRSTTNSASALTSLHWLPIRLRIDYKLATLVHRSLHNACLNICHLYTTGLYHNTSASLCPFNLLSQPHVNIALASRGFWHAGPPIWNSLPPHLRSVESYTAFRSNLKTHLISGSSISGP